LDEDESEKSSGDPAVDEAVDQAREVMERYGDDFDEEEFFEDRRRPR
jgi:hypothetical protein